MKFVSYKAVRALLLLITMNVSIQSAWAIAYTTKDDCARTSLMCTATNQRVRKPPFWVVIFCFIYVGEIEIYIQSKSFELTKWDS